MGRVEGEASKYDYHRIYPIETAVEEGEEAVPSATKLTTQPSALRHLRDGDFSKLLILDDVRRLHEAVFGCLRSRGPAGAVPNGNSSPEKLRLRKFVQKSGLLEEESSSAIDLLLAKVSRGADAIGRTSGGGQHIDTLVFCDFLIAIACREWPGLKSEYAALTRLLGKKGMLPSQAKKKLVMQSQFHAPSVASSSRKR